MHEASFSHPRAFVSAEQEMREGAASPNLKQHFICDECDKLCASQAHLNTHALLHTGERPFICPECSQRFGNQNQLNKHVAVHTGYQPYSCTLCSAIFNNHRACLSHVKAVHFDQLT